MVVSKQTYFSLLGRVPVEKMLTHFIHVYDQQVWIYSGGAAYWWQVASDGNRYDVYINGLDSANPPKYQARIQFQQLVNNAFMEITEVPDDVAANSLAALGFSAKQPMRLGMPILLAAAAGAAYLLTRKK